MSSEGLSILIYNDTDPKNLQDLLHSFVQINTYSPIEFLVITQDKAACQEVISPYATKLFTRLIADQDRAFAPAVNAAASKARFDQLLFLDQNVHFSQDVLPQLVPKLDEAGVVGIRLDQHPDEAKDQPPAVLHAGITFVWGPKVQQYRPKTITHANRDQFLKTDNNIDRFPPAVSRSFLLCSRQDFQHAGGFCGQYTNGLADVDLCLHILGQGKSVHLIPDLGLPLRSHAPAQLLKKDVDLLHKRVAELGKKGTNLPENSGGQWLKTMIGSVGQGQAVQGQKQTLNKQPVKAKEQPKAATQQKVQPGLDKESIEKELNKAMEHSKALEQQLTKLQEGFEVLEQRYLQLPDESKEKNDMEERLHQEVLAMNKILIEMKNTEDDIQELRQKESAQS